MKAELVCDRTLGKNKHEEKYTRTNVERQRRKRIWHGNVVQGWKSICIAMRNNVSTFSVFPLFLHVLISTENRKWRTIVCLFCTVFKIFLLGEFAECLSCQTSQFCIFCVTRDAKTSLKLGRWKQTCAEVALKIGIMLKISHRTEDYRIHCRFLACSHFFLRIW